VNSNIDVVRNSCQHESTEFQLDMLMVSGCRSAASTVAAAAAAASTSAALSSAKSSTASKPAAFAVHR
jgi:hypothetical protein